MDEKQYIIIKLDKEEYGIDIQHVDSIVHMQRITRVPKAQSYFKGVINLRGEIIPVMSLRLKFGLEPDEETKASRIVILKLEPQSSIGIIVDEVKNVIRLNESQIDKTVYTNTEQSSYIQGIGKQGERLISLLNIANVIIEKELS